MKSYSEIEIFEQLDRKLLEWATQWVACLKDPVCCKRGHPERLRCHEVARAVLRAIPAGGPNRPQDLRVVDGKYGSVDHSWIAWRGGDGQVRILDVYCVGQLPQVQLLMADGFLPHRKNYVPDMLPRTDIQDDRVTELHDQILTAEDICS